MSKTANRSRHAGKAAAECWRASTDEPLQRLVDDPQTPPLLKETVLAIPWQTRNASPLGRLITSPAFAPQCLAALLALGATVETGVSTATGVPLEDFLVENGSSRPSQIVVRACGAAWGRASVARTPPASPIVSGAAVVESRDDTIQHARVALTGVWPDPVGLASAASRLAGEPLTPKAIAETATAVAAECSPKSDFLGSEEYRRAMAAVMTKRALQACAARISGGVPKEKGR
ncbi:MAG: hypothetical protein E3J64_00090 [Anaerolineales bacterium]|nr:MAG: hypothetical protein E3J64_00090 [Anaerolineales bacterium]